MRPVLFSTTALNQCGLLNLANDLAGGGIPLDSMQGVKRMNKAMMALAMTAAVVAVAPAAQAAPVITMSPAAPDGSFSGAFSNSGIAAGAFSDVFNFLVPSGGTVASTISSIFTTNQLNNVSFTSVALNGTEYTIGSTGAVEFRFLPSLGVLTGRQVLSVNGNSGGNGSYAGTLAFTAAATPAVPEPATWALMLMGFGAVGYSMRRRSKVRFAYAV